MAKQSDSPEMIKQALSQLALGPAMLSADAFASPLLAWYDDHGRSLPWRKKWPDLTEPYDVFLSELMLQQTVVATVIPYFQRFKELWPTVHDLASCEEEDLLKQWAGLGYYARARNLRKAALAISAEHNGIFPQDEARLLALPGIGPYTAAAIRAFAFDQPAIVLDGNVERVMARFAGLITALPELKIQLRTIYPQLAPKNRHSDFAQAIMDLGARICISGMPRCEACPLAQSCRFAHHKEAAYVPVKVKKQPKPKREGLIFVATKGDYAVMVRRPDKGLLGGMMGFPTIGWGSASEAASAAKFAPPFAANWQEVEGKVRHIFTHFELNLTIYHAHMDTSDISGDISGNAHQFQFVLPEEVGLASVFAKVWHAVTNAR